MKVLIVEEHPPMRRALSEVMRLAYDGSAVFETPDVAAALAACGELRPDVVLIGVGPPNERGIDFASRLRSQFPAARSVVIASRQSALYQDAARAAGADAYVARQDMHETLLATVSLALTSR